MHAATNHAQSRARAWDKFQSEKSEADIKASRLRESGHSSAPAPALPLARRAAGSRSGWCGAAATARVGGSVAQLAHEIEGGYNSGVCPAGSVKKPSANF